jgi:hypothetical protein
VIETSRGLICLIDGDACLTPVAHLSREQVSTSQLSREAPCLVYEETNKWGSRWRVVEAVHGGKLLTFVDHMGDEDNFKVGGITIPSNGADHESYWNTFGECFDIAEDEHLSTGKWTRKQVPRHTGEQWANQLMEMAEQKRAQSVFGSHIQVER